MKSLATLIFGILGFANALCAQGLLLVKSYSFDKDSEASPIEYKTAAKFGTVYNVVTSSGDSQRLQTGLIVRDILYSTIACPNSLISKPDADRVSANIETLKDTIATWPASRKHLLRYLESNQLALDQLKKGYVLTGSKWIPVQAYNASIAEAQRQAEERQRQAEAARQKEMQVMQEAREKEARAMKEAREKQLELERNAAQVDAAKLEKSVASLRAEAVELASSMREPSTIQKRAFLLRRKLPKADFAELYEIGPYVFETITRGREVCVLVSHSISTLEDRSIDFWVRPLGDIDVTLVSGARERVPVFVEAKENDAAVRLETIRDQIIKANRELETIRVKFQPR